MFAVVFAFLGVGARVGARGSLCFGRPALSFAWRSHAAVGALAWVVVLCAGWGGKVGRGNVAPPHTAWWCCPAPLRGVGREGVKGGVLTGW